MFIAEDRNRSNVSKAEMQIAVQSKPRLMGQVREEIRTRHYSRSTEKTYVYWIKQFIFFNEMKHPEELSEKEINKACSRNLMKAQ